MFRAAHQMMNGCSNQQQTKGHNDVFSVHASLVIRLLEEYVIHFSSSSFFLAGNVVSKIYLYSQSPEDADDVPYENDINAIIHDIGLDISDQNERDEQPQGSGIRKLPDVNLSDEEEPMFMISKSSLAFLTDFIPYKKCLRPECQQQLEIKERHVGCGLILRWVRD